MNYIHKIRNILTHLDSSIRERSPFSLIRFGDGGIKAIHSYIFCDVPQLSIISEKEGIPLNKFEMLIDGWAAAVKYTDYLDSQEMYFDGRFWPRLRKPQKGMTAKTKDRMLMWDDLYGRVEFENFSYCNPESNYLSVLRVDGWPNILDVMKNRKVCVITAVPTIKYVLRQRGFDVDIIEIVGHYEDQYENSYHNVMKYIEQTANVYDLWLVAAGELGRLYSGKIRRLGGRCFDIGFIIEFWSGKDIHPRLYPFMRRSLKDPMELKLTEEGKKFERFI